MSTRGAVGIRLGGIDKIGYNHYDSYPDGLGKEVIMYLKCKSVDKLKKAFGEIEFDDSPDNDVWDWSEHRLNRKFRDYGNFMADSLFNEWSYIINLDSGVLEIYHGFNKDPNANGRYASQKRENDDGEYYGVVLEKEIPLEELFHGEYEVRDDEFVKAGDPEEKS